MRRLLLRLVTAAPGGPGTRPGALRPLREELAGQGRLGPFRGRSAFMVLSLRAKARGKKRRGPGSADPGSEIAASGAPRGASPRSQAERTRLARRVGRLRRPLKGSRKPLRFPALRSPHRGRWNEMRCRPTRGRSRIRAMAHACLTIPSTTDHFRVSGNPVLTKLR